MLTGLVELQCLSELVLVTPWPSAFPASCPSGSQPLFGALCNHIALKLCQRRHERKEQLTGRSTGVDLFLQTDQLETVVLLSKLNTKQHIEVELNLDELDLTAAESKATYDEIKAYVLEKYGLKVSSLYISQVKRKCGLDVGQNYNLSKKEDAKVPQCPPEKEAAIMDALKHFHMV